MTDELKPCPFCGGKPLAYDMLESLSICTVECSGCDITVEGRTTEAAATKWNTRALTAAQPAQAGEVDEREQVYSAQLTKAKHLLVDLHKIGGERVQAMIETRTGSWFVWGQDRSLPTQPAAQATPEPVGEARCSTCGVTMNELHHPACGAVTAAIIGLNTMAAQDKEARRRELAEKIRETLRGVFTHPAPGVPDGVALVPVEPTEAMLAAFIDASPIDGGTWAEATEEDRAEVMNAWKAPWSAMLAAAQAKGGAA